MADLLVKNLDLWNALVVLEPNEKPPLAKLAALDLPAKASYTVKKLLRKATEEFKDIDAARNDLLTKYAQKDDTGELKKTPDGTGVVLAFPDEFATAFAELLDQPATLAGCSAIRVEDLGDAKVSAEVLARLDAFVTGE